MNLEISDDGDDWGRVFVGAGGFKNPVEYTALLERTEFTGEKYGGELGDLEFFTQLGGKFNWLQKPISEAQDHQLLMQIYYSSLNEVKGGEGVLLDGCGYVFQSSEKEGKLYFQFG